MPKEVLKQTTLETIENRYPLNKWLHVYTDGSQIYKNGTTGAGIHCDLFQMYHSLGRYHTAFDGEIKAITTALSQLTCRTLSSHNVVILSDSKAAISAIANHVLPSTSIEITLSRQFARQMRHLGKNVHLQWIPSHCGVSGNEKADLLAKKGTQISQTSLITIPYRRTATNIHHMVREAFHANLQEQTKNKPWKDKLPTNVPEWPRKEAVAIFRTITGHDCLGKHLHRLGILPTPCCMLCNSLDTMDADHIRNCPSLKAISFTERYWEARTSMMI